MANLIVQKSPSVYQKNEKDDSRDLLTKLRIGNRLVSKEVIKIQMKGRSFLSLENLSNNQFNKSHLDETEWVTAGVIHRIVNTRSQSGRHMSYIQITDLKDYYVNVFLNGDFSHFTMIPVGELVYLINPSIVSSKESNHTIALYIKSEQNIKRIGKVIDYGICQSNLRNGGKCQNAVNLEISRYCMYHIKRTQENLSALRADVNPESTGKNKCCQNISEGRFTIGKEIIDCRPIQASNEIDLSTLSSLQYYRSKGTQGMAGGYIASRMLEKSKEEERKRKHQEEKIAELKRRKEMNSKENANQPMLGRGLLPGNIIRLDKEDSQYAKIQSLKARLAEEKEKKELKKETKELTGNSVFDSLIQKSSQSSLQREEILQKESVYSEKALQEKVRIQKERDAMIERKELEKLKMMSMEITCYWCANCQKFVENGIGRKFCENQGHFLERRKETKRMFECQECHNRTAFIGIEKPIIACACGGYVWKPCSFYKQKDVKMEELKITTPNTHTLYCHDIK